MEWSRRDPQSTIKHYTFLEDLKKQADQASHIQKFTSLFSALGGGDGKEVEKSLQAINIHDEPEILAVQFPLEPRSSPVSIFYAVDNDANLRDSIYRPLDATKQEFRVVKLLPELSNGLVSCELEYESFEDEDLVSYQPLSYVVGSIDNTQEILLNGLQFKVTSNLHAALLHLRSSQGECRLWIDQLSINQHDNEEKGSQVLLMKQIFGRGSRTFMWIPDVIPESSFAAAELIREVFERFVQAYKEKFKTWSATEPLPQDPVDAIRGLYSNVCATYSRILVNPARRAPFDALRVLLEEGYWQRCWIWQEICVSKEALVLWGQNEFRWEELAETVRTLSYTGSMLKSWVRSNGATNFEERMTVLAITSVLRGSYVLSVKEMRTAWWAANPSLSKLLSYSRTLNCTDLRDKVYGILGLVGMGNLLGGLRPEYQKTSMPMACFRAAVYCINTENSLDVMCLANERQRHQEWNLPSWVPDFSIATGRTRELLPGMVFGDAYVANAAATRGLELNFNFKPEDPLVIQVQTIKFGEPLDEPSLGEIGIATAGKSDTVLRNWQDIVSIEWFMGTPATLPGYMMEFLSAITFGNSRRSWEGHSIDDVINGVRSADEHDAESARDYEIFEEALLSGNWRFFCNTELIKGMVPAATQNGDQLCFIPGARTPFVIRERKEAGGGYILIGACYIHDYMHGKIAEDLQKGRARSGSVESEWIDLY